MQQREKEAGHFEATTKGGERIIVYKIVTQLRHRSSDGDSDVWVDGGHRFETGSGEHVNYVDGVFTLLSSDQVLTPVE